MTVTPAGWYPCPQDPAQHRWWDGKSWTEHTRPAAEVPTVPAVASPGDPASVSVALEAGAITAGKFIGLGNRLVRAVVVVVALVLCITALRGADDGPRGDEVSVTGTVISQGETQQTQRYRSNGHSRTRTVTVCAPTAEFTVDGVRHRTELGTTARRCPEVGTTVDVAYDPADPDGTARLAAPTLDRVGYLVLIAFTVLLASAEARDAFRRWRR